MNALLEALALIILLVVFDTAFGSGLLLRWLGVAEEDSKWDTDSEYPVGKVVVVITAFGATRDTLEGSVELNGASWNARAFDGTHGFDEGDKAKVDGIDGLTLVVTMINV